MKKFVLASLAILAAVAAQSAQVVWSSGDLRDLRTADIQSIKGYYYTITADQYAFLASTSQEDLYNQFYKNPDVTANSGESGIAMNDRGSINWTQTDASEPAYVVAVYVAESSYGGSYALASLAKSGTTAAEEGSEFEDPDSVLNSNIGVAAYYGPGETARGWAAVPEPTTVALLALGLAAVGLKRKVA